MQTEEFEERFKHFTGLDQTLTNFPITELVQFNVDSVLRKTLGEVFTPLKIVDQMIQMAEPHSHEFNLDLCAGRGQFTIRMLRYFQLQDTAFQPVEYLTNYHWFNELNIKNALDLIRIFGENINLCVGPGQLLHTMPSAGLTWQKGIFFHDESEWERSSKQDLENKLVASPGKKLF